MYNLLRNISGSLFISLVTTLLAQNTQVIHAQLGESLTPFRDALQQPWLPPQWDWSTTAGALAIDGELSRQAAAMAYFMDFSLMHWMVLVTAPLLLLFRKIPKPEPDAPAEEKIPLGE